MHEFVTDEERELYEFVTDEERALHHSGVSVRTIVSGSFHGALSSQGAARDARSMSAKARLFNTIPHDLFDS